MKAAVVLQKGEFPRLVIDFDEPIIDNGNEVLVTMKASALKNLDKIQATGKHYSNKAEEHFPKIVGGDGVGLLEDGTRVYGIGRKGMMAEKAIMNKNAMVKLPEDIDDAVAAALPNAVMGAVMALKFRACMKSGDTVLINGATGVTGKMAVQIAKMYGAKWIIATGRNEQSLQELKGLGADEIISLKQLDQNFTDQISSSHHRNSINIVLDFLWGNSAELILSALKGNGESLNKIRFISIGGVTGDNITLSSSILRGTDIQISGSGLGSWSAEEIKSLLTEILPEMFQLAADGKLKIDTQCININEVEKAWGLTIDGGKRLVITF